LFIAISDAAILAAFSEGGSDEAAGLLLRAEELLGRQAREVELEVAGIFRQPVFQDIDGHGCLL